MGKTTRRSFGKYLSSIFSAADLVVVNVLFAVTVMLCPNIADSPRLRTLWVLVNTSYLPVMWWMGRQKHHLRVLLMDHVARCAFIMIGLHALFFFSLLAFLEIDDVPVSDFLVFYGLMVAVVPLWWIVSRMIIKYMRRRGYNFTRVAIVGTGTTAKRLFGSLQSDDGFGYKVLGFFDDDPAPGFNGKLLGRISDIDRLCKAYMIDQVFYTLTGEDEKSLSTVLKAADDNVIQFYYVPRISSRVPRSFELNTIGSVPVLSVRRNPLNNPLNSCIKRLFDIGFSSVVLLFSPLVFIPVALAIKLTSPGPIFFRQERTGYRGKTFKCWKFRTMQLNNSADTRQAMQKDPRTTGVGRFLRRTSIDELPQFLNVFLGSMSVVGPRPHMLKHTEIYAKLIDPYMLRHAVKPGITGWAQVNGYRGPTDELWKMEKRVECDVWYIENWSFLLDVKIIIRTLINIFEGEKNAC